MGGKLHPLQPADRVRGGTGFLQGPLGSLVLPPGQLGLCLSSRGAEGREGWREGGEERGRGNRERRRDRAEGSEAELAGRERESQMHRGRSKRRESQRQERESKLDTQRKMAGGRPRKRPRQRETHWAGGLERHLCFLDPQGFFGFWAFGPKR